MFVDALTIGNVLPALVKYRQRSDWQRRVLPAPRRRLPRRRLRQAELAAEKPLQEEKETPAGIPDAPDDGQRVQRGRGRASCDLR